MVNYSEKDVINFVEENDVKFIRLAFIDLFGHLRNLAIMQSELPTALKRGIPLDASIFYGRKDCSHNDIYLVPDTSTLSVLPWRPRAGRVVRFFCHLKNHDGTPFEGDIREKLRKTADQYTMNGFTGNIGTEAQFYLFELDENGEPTKKTNDKAGYLDIAPLDHGENIRREICLSLDEMGIYPETSRHLYGNGQNEITFKYSHALTAADNHLNFKAAVKSIAFQNGLYASFMPYPLYDQPRSSLLINISISHNGKNIFALSNGKMSDEGRRFMAGVLRRIPDMTLFFNPTSNSYHRNGIVNEPSYINWATERRDALIRVVNTNTAHERIELRSPDPACNMHLLLNLVFKAGLEGLKEKLELPPENDTSSKLPSTFSEAIYAAENSEFIKNNFSEFSYKRIFAAMNEKAEKYEKTNDKAAFEDDVYFKYI